jgi:hypothetical protein
VLLAAMVFTKKRFEVNAAALDRKLNA